jgi:hypothetical protein
MELALTCNIYEADGLRTVNVPNILLQTAKPVKVHLSMMDSDGILTTYSQVIPVVARVKPENYVYTETEALDYAYLNKRLEQIEKNGVSSELIATAVDKYLRENPISAGSTATIGAVELLAAKWVGGENLYSQVVNIDGTTEYSQVDLTPSVEQLAVFHEKDLTFVTENEDGVVTVYAIGQKPTNDYTIQVTITEVQL